MSKIVCRFCVMESGIRGSDLAAWPEEGSPGADEWLFRHLESEHHITVVRAGETRQQAEARFAWEQPEAGGPNCRCPECRRRRQLSRMLAR